jgi:hypothetical protein
VVIAWHKLVDIVETVKTALDPWFSELATKLSGVGQILEDAFKGMDFDKVMEGLKVGFLGGHHGDLEEGFWRRRWRRNHGDYQRLTRRGQRPSGWALPSSWK